MREWFLLPSPPAYLPARFLFRWNDERTAENWRERKKAANNFNAFVLRSFITLNTLLKLLYSNVWMLKIDISSTLNARTHTRTHSQFSGLHYCIELFINGCDEFCFIGFSHPITCIRTWTTRISSAHTHTHSPALARSSFPFDYFDKLFLYEIQNHLFEQRVDWYY